MKSALIGYTGFVGSNLMRQTEFTDVYNSKNIDDIDGREYDLVVCSAARAEKWRINQEPEKDLAEIDALIAHLKTIKAKTFVLVSTVDVYKNPIDVNEDTPIETEGLHAYGRNRFYLETFCKDTFDATIVRLPALFGQGLKKNVIFDLLNDNQVHKIHYAGAYQYYNLDNIWKDITLAVDNNIKLLNLATEPVTTEEIANECFDIEFKNEPEGVTAGRYDMQTKHAGLFGKSGPYAYGKEQELADIKAFVASERAK